MVQGAVPGLLDNIALRMMRREMRRTFDTQVEWYKQKYDNNGKPVSNLYGQSLNWDAPATVDARIQTEIEESYDGTATIRHQSTRMMLPPYTGVRAGDVILPKGTPFTDRALIVAVAQSPSNEQSVFELVTLGIGV